MNIYNYLFIFIYKLMYNQSIIGISYMFQNMFYNFLYLRTIHEI